jgi:uncharacterized membrane protein YfcA
MWIVLIASLVAGFIDAIAGGGGLITLPAYTLVLGPGANAIGSNKVGAVLASSVALFVYSRKGHVDWKTGVVFSLWIAMGSAAGSFVSPHIPPELFKAFLVITCPSILWVVWKKDLWVTRELVDHAQKSRPTVSRLLIPGLVVGFYDGVWGPGGGTFMFLALLFVAGLPLLQALGASKLANAASAAASLTGYATQGHVNWKLGLLGAVSISFSAWIGAHFATRNAGKVVRTVLAIVVCLLLIRLLAY